MPDGAIVVNTARGAVVDDDALIEALRSGKLFAAGKSSLAPEQARDVVLGVMNKEQQEVFLKDHECNFAINTLSLW